MLFAILLYIAYFYDGVKLPNYFGSGGVGDEAHSQSMRDFV